MAALRDHAAHARVLAEGITDLPLGPTGTPWTERVAKLIQLALEEVEQETRQRMIVDSLAAIHQKHAELVAAAEAIKEPATKAETERRTGLFNQAKGVTDAAGLIGEIVNGTKSYADNADQKPQP